MYMMLIGQRVLNWYLVFNREFRKKYVIQFLDMRFGKFKKEMRI